LYLRIRHRVDPDLYLDFYIFYRHNTRDIMKYKDVKNKNVVERQIEGKGILLIKKETEECYFLKDLAEIIWKMLEEEKEQSAILNALLKILKAPPPYQQLCKDVEEFLQDLEAEQVIIKEREE